MKATIFITLLTAVLCAEEYYNRGKLTTLTPTTAPVSSTSRSNPSIQWFRTESGQIVGTTDHILVQYKKPESAIEIINSLGIKKFEWLTKSMMTVTVPKGADIFDLARKLSEHSAVAFAHPDFYTERGLR